jgi:type I restriction enzyme, S subunit
MIEGLKPYAEYKESGQKWLGGVPAHWELKPGHAAFAPRKESNRGMKEKTVLSLSYGRIKVKATDKQHGLVPESYETYQVVNEGNIIIRGTDLQNDQTSLRIGLSRNRGIISSAYLCLEAQPSITPDYGYQILNVFDITKAIYRFGSGLRQNLDHGEIKRLPIFLPPLDEQAAIVRFLDHANRKIDGFIRAKRKLIGLLNEQKQAIIHRAVTRGLHPDVPLKPSGIPWLGDIPMHWEVWRVSRFAKVGNGSTPSRSNMGFWSGGNYPWLNSSHVNRGFIDSADQFVTSSALRECHLPKVAAGSVLIAITGQGKTRGTSAVLGFEATINQHIAYITPRIPVVTAKYLHLSLVAAYSTLRSISDDSGSTKGALTCEDLKRFKIAVPPVAEQERAVEAIAKETAALTTAIARTEREISLMQEYRTRLTADLVTGKLDVREAAAHLPTPPAAIGSEVAEDELLDEVETEGVE